MPDEMAQDWADARPPEWIDTVLRDRDVWVFESVGVPVGWISVSIDTIDGLYTQPRYERCGIGSRLLAFAESLMRQRGLSVARLDASWNAEEFYARRGYEAVEPRPADGARPMHKLLYYAHKESSRVAVPTGFESLGVAGVKD
jgi:putative acetyltransferase